MGWKEINYLGIKKRKAKINGPKKIMKTKKWTKKINEKRKKTIKKKNTNEKGGNGSNCKSPGGKEMIDR